MTLPRLTKARAPLTREVEIVDEHGERGIVSIPAERDLTVYVDRRELVTLMTLGAEPELLVLGYLLNQRLIESAADVESITVDWEVGGAAVRTHTGIDRIEERTAKKVVTTGCGQGSVFGELMAGIERLRLPDTRITQAQLYALVNTFRVQESTYKSAGSVHGCALFTLGDDGEAVRMRCFVEDVGRHNAIDTIAGWIAMQPAHELGGARVFYTTGRLTSEMIIKSAQMGVAIVVSRSGITQMGHEVANRVGLCAIGRATNRRFLCFAGAGRLLLQPELAGTRQPAAA
ncbi:formate dehydrogenase accessory sulfurtransferase FdhD [Variovorax sp. YR216]|uniref:formate dehydrogenase accessory sulfurtransferase FdhD n=1 Tax=Variovorax sp. YR216 TaxID=1882828 RepID=UPI00089D03B8|nr:formate dehydrogenase accessory sulfurtransferase FdhD [Variovorax sp. YR216]SEA91217.1 FdhD protein [Variovorax sp. YR216]